MDHTTALVIAVCIFALLLIGFFARNWGKGKFRLSTPLGDLQAEGENPPALASLPAGASTEDVKAAGDVLTNSTSEGGVRAKGIDSGGIVTTTHTPGAATPPKL